MRFMIIRMADEETEAGAPAGAELMEAMGSYNAELADAGMLLAGEGLAPTSAGVRVRFSGGRTTVIDGPFTEAKELIAGYTMIRADSKEQALEWARRWPALDGGGCARLEIRQVFEPTDFGAKATGDETVTLDRER